MRDTLRSSSLGQILNYLSNGRLLPYPEEQSDYTIPDRYRLHPDDLRGTGASEPTLVDNRSTSKNSKFRNSVALSIPDSNHSGYATYNSRSLFTEKGADDTEKAKQSTRPAEGSDVERGGMNNDDVALRETPSRAGSVGGRSVDTQEKVKREREHWTKRMMRDPELVKREGLEDDYEYLVRWDGPDDPENPQYVDFALQCSLRMTATKLADEYSFRYLANRNFSRGKKLFISGQVCLMTFSVYLGASLITASETGLQEEFGISQTVSILALSLYILG